MADRALFPIAGSLTRDLVPVVGRWALGAAGAVGTKVCGEGMSLARTGVGAYTLTFTDKFPRVAAVQIDVSTTDPATQGFKVNKGTYSASAKTQTFVVFDVETPAATDVVNGEVTVVAWFSNTNG